MEALSPQTWKLCSMIKPESVSRIPFWGMDTEKYPKVTSDPRCKSETSDSGNWFNPFVQKHSCENFPCLHSGLHPRKLPLDRINYTNASRRTRFINFAKVETPPTLVFQNERHYSYGYNIQWHTSQCLRSRWMRTTWKNRDKERCFCTILGPQKLGHSGSSWACLRLP